MDTKLYEKLKQDLSIAIAQKDYKKVEELKHILNVSSEQERYFDIGLTGYPSIDRTWLKKYQDGAEERANNIPVNKTVWDVIEEKILEYYDIPILEYFNREFSRPEFRDLCYTWARTFRAMGVEEDEIVPVYGPVVPDICAMFFGLNMIGACPYFLKLAITPDALAEETAESKIAIVYDGMWQNVAEEFMKDRFKNVMVATVTADMPSPKKEIVSFISKIQAMKNKSKIPDEKKYIWADKARDIANYYSGEVKVPFKSDRNTVITSSSGTTVGGVVKGVVATNESIISQVLSGTVSEIPYTPGGKVLNHFPFTAATSMNSLFLLPIYNGMTVYVDPRVSEDAFYNQIMTLKPNIALTTGSAWEAFFNRVMREMKKGKKFDFSFAIGWTIGGEGIDPKKYQLWNEIMIKCGAKGIYSGYGLSEVFSAVSVEKVDARCDASAKAVLSVGLPQAGMIVGTFDKDGNELSYNQRGELWIKTNAMMKEYYNKSELTNKTVVDGWIHTGDLATIDEDGFLYVWGREKDSIQISKDEKIYLFDVANKIKEFSFIDDAIVLPMPTNDNPYNLVAHVVINSEYENDIVSCYEELNNSLQDFLPRGIVVSAYAEHDVMLPYSPTTLKKDKNKMSKQTTGYVQVVDGEIKDVEFISSENGLYDMIVNEKQQSKKRIS